MTLAYISTWGENDTCRMHTTYLQLSVALFSTRKVVGTSLRVRACDYVAYTQQEVGLFNKNISLAKFTN